MLLVSTRSTFVDIRLVVSTEACVIGSGDRKVAAQDVEYQQSSREQQTGVTRTPHMEGKIPWHKLLMGNNMNALVEECNARNIPTVVDGKSLGWTQMKKKIQEQDRSVWTNRNPGKVVPDEIKQHFKQISNANFVLKERQ